MARCLALFSGGLDSILACRVIQQQDIEVIAVKFISPFFDYHLLKREESYQTEIWEKFKINVILHDISADFLTMLANPAHGYGKNFNPCVDCKILIISKAKEMMSKLGASFLITGEVIGQRPMSQRKDTLRVIERDSSTDDILLRPLCSQSQKPTAVERDGIVNRDLLPKFSGRNRTPQIELAAKLGITTYPDPAGGCILTDPNLSSRIAALYAEDPSLCTPSNIIFLLQGRQFRLPGGSWLSLGRNETENDKIATISQDKDFGLYMADRPGPFGLLRYCQSDQDKTLAAALVVSYGKKTVPPDQAGEVTVQQGNSRQIIFTPPATRDEAQDLIFAPA